MKPSFEPLASQASSFRGRIYERALFCVSSSCECSSARLANLHPHAQPAHRAPTAPTAPTAPAASQRGLTGTQATQATEETQRVRTGSSRWTLLALRSPSTTADCPRPFKSHASPAPALPAAPNSLLSTGFSLLTLCPFALPLHFPPFFTSFILHLLFIHTPNFIYYSMHFFCCNYREI